MAKSLVEMAADIVQSQSATRNMTTDEITYALQQTFTALHTLQQGETAFTAPGAGETAVDGETGAGKTPSGIAPDKSIQKNKIVCLECGQEFRMLSPKHLKSHGLSGREYRTKYGFSLRQPLCAKTLSERRKKAGRERGLPDNLMKAIKARRRDSRKMAAKEA
ncbi:MAG: transcriptional regulator [Desulfobacteraceae bacterium]|nr:MAG: transcriptional regulator [Desulfobacteraceae bacterium]